MVPAPLCSRRLIPSVMGEYDISLSMPVYIRWLEVRFGCYFDKAESVRDNEPDIPIVVGKHVITVEGLGNVNNPHPLQERLSKLHGSQ